MRGYRLAALMRIILRAPDRNNPRVSARSVIREAVNGYLAGVCPNLLISADTNAYASSISAPQRGSAQPSE